MRILIVEDEIVSTMFLERAVKSWGHEVAGHATTGEEAIPLAVQIKPDVILMDISLAGEINGIEASISIKMYRQVPVIFITGYDTAEFRNQAIALKPSAYMIKPINLVELRRLIDTMTGKTL